MKIYGEDSKLKKLILTITEFLFMAYCYVAMIAVMIGFVALVVQIFNYLQHGMWSFYSPIDFLSIKKLNFSWAQQPETMLGTHKILLNTDMWMLLPAGIVSLITIVIALRLLRRILLANLYR